MPVAVKKYRLFIFLKAITNKFNIGLGNSLPEGRS